jgi:hypothetical protein
MKVYCGDFRTVELLGVDHYLVGLMSNLNYCFLTTKTPNSGRDVAGVKPSPIGVLTIVPVIGINTLPPL